MSGLDQQVSWSLSSPRTLFSDLGLLGIRFYHHIHQGDKFALHSHIALLQSECSNELHSGQAHVCGWHFPQIRQDDFYLDLKHYRKTRKLRALSFLTWALLPPYDSSNHHSTSDHKGNQPSNNAHHGNAALRRGLWEERIK